MPDRVKLSFVIFDIRALWRSVKIQWNLEAGSSLWLVNLLFMLNCCFYGALVAVFRSICLDSLLFMISAVFDPEKFSWTLYADWSKF